MKTEDRIFRVAVVSFIMFVIILFLTMLSGCTTPNRETGTWIKEGIVTKIEYDVIFGGTFTDWRDDIYFDDGTILSSQARDLSSIRLNEAGRYYFDKNYFEYDGYYYKFDNFIRVEYYDET